MYPLVENIPADCIMILATALRQIAHSHGLFILLFVEFWKISNLDIWWLIYTNRTINESMIMVMIMAIIIITISKLVKDKFIIFGIKMFY